VIDRSTRKDEIAQRLSGVRSELPSETTLIVVTKNFPVSDIEILFELGEREFGENRVQELVSKREAISTEMDDEITWHFQGQIQSNKAASLNRFADVIHSIDSEKLIERISPDREVFLQVNLDPDGQSNSRAGIDPKDLEDFSRMMVARFAGNFLGLMAVAPHFAGITTSQIGESFERLKVLSRKVQEIAPNAKAISAGMSDDYRLALEHGATHIRLGSSILGQRTPNT
jgi:pyridoxal phosphate enzyme (YggS family)